MPERNFTPETIHAANKAKGFYDMEMSVLEKARVSMNGNPDGTRFTEEEYAAIQRAFQLQRIALMVSELGEAVEAIRKDKTVLSARLNAASHLPPVSHLDPENKNDVTLYREMYKDTVEDEKADTVIRLYDDAGRNGCDLDAHIRMKLAVNRQRAFMHGKNC